MTKGVVQMMGSSCQSRLWFMWAVALSVVRAVLAVLDPGIGIFALFDVIALFITVVFYIAIRSRIKYLGRDAAKARAMGWDRYGARGARYMSAKATVWLFVIMLSLVVVVSSAALVLVALLAVNQGRCMLPVQLLPFETAIPLAVVHLLLAAPVLVCLVLLGRALLAEVDGV